MKKMIIFAVISIALSMIGASLFVAYASEPFISHSFNSCFHCYLYEAYYHLLDYWEESEHYYSDGTFIFTKTANLDGHPYTIEISGENDIVDIVCFTGWFEDMKIQGYGKSGYSLGLEAYDACLFSCEEYIHDVVELGDYIVEDSCFASASIYRNVSEGSGYRAIGVHWDIIPTDPGRFLARHSNGYVIEAQRMSNGMMRFTLTF